MSDHYARAQLVALQMHRLSFEARSGVSAERLTAIADEMEVLHESLVQIREDQLMEQFEKPAPRRAWWRSLFRRSV